MEGPVETVSYKKYKINIYRDIDCESPDSWQDTECFLVAYHRDFYVQHNEIITKDQAISIFKGSTSEKEILSKYHCFGLKAYIHSGVCLDLSNEGNFPDRRWDVSQVGLILVSKNIEGTKKITRKEARKYATNLLETWNSYLSGEVYGFQTTDSRGNDIDSCWGFYGDCKYCLEDAKAGIDVLIKDYEK